MYGSKIGNLLMRTNKYIDWSLYNLYGIIESDFLQYPFWKYDDVWQLKTQVQGENEIEIVLVR